MSDGKKIQEQDNSKGKFDFLYRAIRLKLYLMSIATGLLVGIVTVPYRYLITKSVMVRDLLYSHANAWYIQALIILGLWGIALLLLFMIKKTPMLVGSGIPQVEGYICNRFTIRHSIWEIVQKFFGGIVAVGMGMSLGREGPSVQIGAFIGNLISKWGKVNESDKRFLITSGAAAGLSTAFTAPLASTIFIHEEVTKYQSAKSTATAFLAAIASGWIARIVFSGNEYAALNSAMPDKHELRTVLIALVGLAIMLAAFGKLFNFLMVYFQDLRSKLKKAFSLPVYLLIIVIITYLLGLYIPDILAGGEPLIFSNVGVGGSILTIALLLAIKMVYTPLCYSTSFPGGIFLPLLVIRCFDREIVLSIVVLVRIALSRL